MKQVELRRLVLVTTVSALSLTALFAIFALLTGSFDETQVRILATTGGFGLASLLATPGTRLLEQGRHVGLGQAVVGLAALSFVVELWPLWLDTENDRPWRSLVVVAAVTVALAQIAQSLSRRRPSDPEAVRLLALGAGVCALVLAGLIALAAIAQQHDSGYYRFLGSVAVLDVLLAFLQPVVRRFGTPVAPSGRGPGFVLVLADGRRVQREASTRDLPDMVASSLRDHLQRGEHIRRIELEA
jgi:hypothetical protein